PECGVSEVAWNISPYRSVLYNSCSTLSTAVCLAREKCIHPSNTNLKPKRRRPSGIQISAFRVPIRKQTSRIVELVLRAKSALYGTSSTSSLISTAQLHYHPQLIR